MDLSIKNKHENTLLSRWEVTAQIDFAKAVTPKKEDVRAAVAKALHMEADHVIVKNISTQYGANQASITAYAYKDKAIMGKLETDIAHAEKRQAKKGAKQQK